MISVTQLLDHLEQEQLLAPALLANIRKQVAESETPIAAATVLKKLVEKGHLTAFQSQRLLALPAAEKPPADAPATGGPSAAADVYGLAPIDEAAPAAKAAPPLAAQPVEVLASDSLPVAKPLFGPIKSGELPHKSGEAAGKKLDSASKKIEPLRPTETTIRPIESSPDQVAAADKNLRLLDAELPSSSAAARPTPSEEVDEYAIVETPEEQTARQTVEEELREQGERRASLTVKQAAATPVEPLAGSFRAKLGQQASGWSVRLGDMKLRFKRKQPRGPAAWKVWGLVAAFVVPLAAWGVWQFTQPVRPDGGPALVIADTAYQKGDLRDAVEKYDAFLQYFHWHEAAGRCRVRRGLARLKLAKQSEGALTLDAVKTALADMAPCREFAAVQAEMADLLPPVAEALCGQARRTPEAAAVRQAREAVAVARRVVPPSLRNPSQEAQWELSLALAQREADRSAALTQAATKIKAAAEQGRWSEAYTARTALLKSYADLTENASLREAMQNLAAAEQRACAWLEQKRAAATQDAASPIVAAVGLAARQLRQEAAENKGRVLPFYVDGVAYALDAASGKLLWRRYTGYPAHGRSADLAPTPLGSQPDSDLAVVDAAAPALLRVDARTGRVRWRQALDDRVETPPVVLGERLYAVSAAGKLMEFALTDGALHGVMQMPQAVPVGPAVDVRRELIFLVGEQASLYVIRADDHDCRQTVDLKHESGSAVVAPTAVEGLLLLPINDRLHEATLRVMALRDDRGAPVRIAQWLALSDAIDVPPSVGGDRVAVTTVSGRRHIFAVRSSDPQKPLAEIQVEVGAVDLLPPRTLGDTVYVVRRRPGVPGACVTASAQGQTLWQTHVGAPWAAAPLVAADGLSLVTAAGGVHKLDAAAVQGASAAEASAVPAFDELPGPVTGAVALDGGRWVFGGEGGRQLFVYEPQSAAGAALRRLPLPDVLGGPPALLSGGLLVLGRSGQAALLDPRDGSKMAEPFQPLTTGAVESRWTAPCAVGADQAALSDGREKLVLLALNKTERPHLEAVGSTPSQTVVRSRLAAAHGALFGADAANTLTAYALPQLTPGESWALGSRCAWGPMSAGPTLLVAAAEKLRAISAERKTLWEINLPYGPPVGEPLVQAAACMLATRSGALWKIDLASGKELGRVDLGRPLGAGPVLWGTRLLTGGHDGTLYEVKPF